MKMNKTLLSAAVAVGLLSTSTVTHAAGFQLAEYSATGLGRAYAGEAAIADNAGSQWRNPALLTYLEGTQVSVGAIYVDPNIDIDGTSTSAFTGAKSSSNSSDFAHSAVIPNFYVSHKYNDKFALGFAAGTNYGMETDLGTDFGGANHGNEASVTTMELNLNAAYQVLESVSIGGGIRYVIAEGSFGATAAATLPVGTTLKYMEGDDTAWGWQVGTAWQINENNRLGFTYKSEVDLTLEGHAKGVGFDAVAGAIGTPVKSQYNGSMQLALPATAELASFHQLTEKVAIHASVNWTNWSSFKELVADIPEFGPASSQDIKEENWEDNYRFAIGTTYQMTPKLALRSGIAYDTSAVSEEHRTATIPETDRTWLSIGAGYQWSDQLTLDAGFTYILAKDAKMLEDDASSAPFGGTFEGEVTGSIWLVGIQANYRF
ncbi:aromatic hydrocarbon degradation protein [Vibrio cyclitrophicus FF160]|uniref:outer membrane protein transport protein n=1 Tax=Vibrio cyclitrophicus TaxID=47951 RepID=UPI0002E9415B|nr:outer membrane protein transport protein [Vibrio cyclitrophicus]OEE84179.1 aromatic hydrocarbon degradation protein [Vibrio cyclitrophicus FF160]PMJ23201.1 aromatic hydrocarbon degradation protein [Vibrio cyclitrophicus]